MNGQQPLGVCFAGAGMVAELHHRAAVEGGHITVAGIVEPRADLARQRAEQWGVTCYPDLDAALSDDAVQAVFALTPSHAHEEVAMKALAAGRPVFIEKPVAEPDAVTRIEEAAAARDLVCMPGHNYAYQPEFTALRRLVTAGDLGTIRAAWITYVIRHPEEVARHYGGILDEVMVHHAYLALALFGVPDLVYAGCMEPAWEAHPETDQAWMTWHYPRGLSVHHFASFAVDDESSDPWMFTVKVLGDRGSATYNWRDSLFRRPLGSLGFAIPAYEDSYIHEQEAFTAAIAGRPGSIVSGLADARDAALLLRTARAADARKAGLPPLGLPPLGLPPLGEKSLCRTDFRRLGPAPPDPPASEGRFR
ncbi:MAG: Gfo/Idh/MocA family oxidoreductase [Nocardiopsaceae bacterium]|nr:Gfo/Idh/MocA family oxidoreductase [Nocardiopsaceae bacterium]